MHDQTFIAFNILCIIGVIVNAVTVECQRRIAKEQRRTELDLPTVCLVRSRNRRFGRGTQGIFAVDQILPFGDTYRARLPDGLVEEWPLHACGAEDGDAVARFDTCTDETCSQGSHSVHHVAGGDGGEAVARSGGQRWARRPGTASLEQRLLDVVRGIDSDSGFGVGQHGGCSSPTSGPTGLAGPWW